MSYFNNGSSIEVIEENNYYPFGMKHEGYNPTAGNPAYHYKYNGKELQTESGMYDYGARFYMPDIGRWGVVDPLAEQYRRFSPYNYTVNNPINFTDPDGRWVRGAGFWDNLTKSDVRIHAEQWADKLGSGNYNVAVNKGGNGTWNVTSHTLISSVKDTFNSKGLANTLYIPYSQGGGLGTAPSSGDPWGASFSSVPDSRGKTQIQTLVSENPFVQDAAIGVFTGGVVNTIRGIASKVGKVATSSKEIIVTQETVTKALQDSNLQTAQGEVSGPMVARYVQRIQNGEIAPPIKVTPEGVIVDGNHRYVAGKLSGVEPTQVPGTLSPSQTPNVTPVQNTKVSPIDWGGY